jgi:peptidoglycan/LPS O-acetylase OafA/YrhL
VQTQPSSILVNPGRQKFAFLDGLRGWAALWVVFNHVQHFMPDSMSSIPAPLRWAVILKGGMGVVIFFTLSGFVITRSISKAAMDAPALGNFFLRRLTRLTPPYYASLVVTVVINYVSTVVKHEAFTSPTFVGVLANLFYLPILVGIEPINGVHWTLYLEVQFYLFIGLLTWLFARHAIDRSRTIRTSVVAILIGLSLIWPLFNLLDSFQPRFLPFFCAFLSGCLIYWVNSGLVPGWLLIVYSGLLGVAAAIHRHEVYVTAFLTLLVILWASRHAAVMSRWLSDRVSRFLGRISFSLYLTHSPVLGATYYFGAKYLGSGKTAQLLLVVPEIGVAIAVGYVFYLIFERPAMAWSNSLKRSVEVTKAIP